MARILLVAPPFSAHLHPLLAVGRRLQAEHDVCVVSTESARAKTAAAGLTAVTLLSGADAAIEALAQPPYAVVGNPLMLNRQLSAYVALMPRFHAEFAALCDAHPPALVIADMVLPVVGIAAQARGIAWWTTLPSPCALETPDGQPAYLGGLLPSPHPQGRIRDAAGRALIRLVKRAIFALHRRELAWTGLRSPYRADGSEAVYSPERVLALGYRELEFARRWPAAVRFVGPLHFVPAAADGVGSVPANAAGPRVLITLGTHLPSFKDAMAEATRRAARRLPHVTFHFTDGDAGGSRAEHDGNFARLSYVPYDLAVRTYDLVVHHGGSGIAYQCLRDGVPALVRPYDYDQFDFAARLVHAGLARRFRRLDALASLVEAALADRQLKAACATFTQIAARYDAAETIAHLVREQLSA